MRFSMEGVHINIILPPQISASIQYSLAKKEKENDYSNWF
jgi:hypothetical protein